MPEPWLLLPELDVRLEVLLAILAPLQRVTARLVLDLRVGRRGRPRERSGHRSPSPSGVADEDRSSAFDTVDFDRDDSFWSVRGLILSFHNMEEPAGIPSARCKIRSIG